MSRLEDGADPSTSLLDGGKRNSTSLGSADVTIGVGSSVTGGTYDHRASIVDDELPSEKLDEKELNRYPRSIPFILVNECCER